MSNSGGLDDFIACCVEMDPCDVLRCLLQAQVKLMLGQQVSRIEMEGGATYQFQKASESGLQNLINYYRELCDSGTSPTERRRKGVFTFCKPGKPARARRCGGCS